LKEQSTKPETGNLTYLCAHGEQIEIEEKPPADSGKLKPEKEEQVQVKSLVKDERTHKIAGAVLLLLAVFLFISFTSYLFTWKQDQDKVFQSGSGFWTSDEIKVNNLLGKLGASISHFFFYKGFGIASYFLCSFFFVFGANLLFGKKMFSLGRKSNTCW
jgi:S-DNA-T family DNA segregation ATPase FtsK/SpoIIIE